VSGEGEVRGCVCIWWWWWRAGGEGGGISVLVVGGSAALGTRGAGLKGVSQGLRGQPAGWIQMHPPRPCPNASQGGASRHAADYPAAMPPQS
jgi:hypothetical protein